MARFWIEVDRDLEEIKNCMPLYFFVPYIKVTQPLYNLLVKKISKKALKKYNPKITDNKARYEQESEDINELQEEKKELENWLFSDKKELYKDERMKKALNLRQVRFAMNKIATKMVLGINKAESVINVFNMNGIFINWGIEL